jgi:hypothetical protein
MNEWGSGGDVQFFSALEMFVVVEEIFATLAPGAVVYAAVFTCFGRFRLAEGSGQGFGCEGFILGWEAG